MAANSTGDVAPSVLLTVAGFALQGILPLFSFRFTVFTVKKIYLVLEYELSAVADISLYYCAPGAHPGKSPPIQPALFFAWGS